jgi:hypothetical protein
MALAFGGTLRDLLGIIVDLLVVLGFIRSCMTRTPKRKKAIAARWMPEFT